jgi:hypothetical protein
MKRIKIFLLTVWKLFVGLFRRSPVKHTVSKIVNESKEIVKRTYHNRKVVPQHNNRRNTRGRFTQHIWGDRAIFHSYKNLPNKV